MRYIYITDCHWDNSEDTDDVMLFPYGDNFEKLTPEIVSELLTLRGWGFNECYWVQAEETQYFCYSPCWLKAEDEAAWIDTLNALKAGKEA